ncbi:hypothetical protein [Enterococcus durans]|uniref:hypothetical protein n=1 Tax=Enterococcus durans TaxID=53345 RepID=UPI0021B058C1
MNFGLFKKELLLLPPFIRESVAKLIFSFVPHSFFLPPNIPSRKDTPKNKIASQSENAEL